METNSYFDGSVIEMIIYSMIAGLITIVTFGLGAAFGIVIVIKWQTEHTVINGKRLMFVGTGIDLFVKSLIWGILTIITFGIYGFWAKVNFMKWKAENTKFAE